MVLYEMNYYFFK